MKQLKLRIANNVDTSRVFSASLRGGVRGEGDCMALETHSNDVVPCVKTLMNWIVICENETNMNEDKKTKVAMKLDEGKWAKMHEQSRKVYDADALAPTMQTCGGGQREPKIVEPICLNSKVNGKQPSVQDRIYSPEGTSTAITTCFHVNIQEPINATPKDFRIRKLTPRECFRLMDVDDKDIDTIQAAGISNSQQYKLAGNSIVVNVLTEIFRKLLVDTQNDDRQLRMF